MRLLTFAFTIVFVWTGPQFVTLTTRTHVTVWLVDWVLVISRSGFSSVGHCF